MSRFRCENDPAGADLLCTGEAAGGAVAQASLWHRTTPQYGGMNVGAIARYRCDRPEFAVEFISNIEGALKERGCEFALAPMEGDTWHAYRWPIEGSAPPFFLEPAADESARAQFEANGYTPVERYISAIEDPIGVAHPNLEAYERGAEERGISIRELRLDDGFEHELRAIHDVSLRAFAHNVLYTPIALEAFRSMYLQLKGVLDPRICLMAEANGHLAGFAFGIEDAVGKSLGQPRTAIVKTLARAPDRDFRGVGTLLLERLRAKFRELGYRRAIHALMHERNLSASMSDHLGARPLRTYALYGKQL